MNKVKTNIKRSQERGQISLMIGLMVGTFILIFLFVINAGILINARINLQNAADMAAYSGAATQARQLNLVSMVNYEMRRQYKKFLFRYYVMGGWGYDDSPQMPGAGENANRRYRTKFLDSQGKPNNSPGIVLGAPVSCFDGLRYRKDASGKSIPESVCRNINLEGISTIPVQEILSETMNFLAQEINTQIEGNCGGLALRNLEVINKWLWNVDPSYELLKTELEKEYDSINPRTKQIASDKLKNLSQLANITRGLGIFPTNLILESRVEEIKNYINQPANRVNLSSVKSMEHENDPFKNERTIQAFYSAYRSLGEHTFSNNDEIIMEEVLPSKLIELQVGRTSFTVFPLIYLGPAGSSACPAELFPLPVLGLPVTVSKDPSVMTYYALRLKGRASLLLPPGLFSTDQFEMEAYAAAQPFGSRIGPVNAQEVADNEFRKSIPFQNIFQMNQAKIDLVPASARYIPWLPINDMQSGWEKADFQKSLVDSGILSIGSQGKNIQNSLPDLSGVQLEQAYETAMMPNPVEIGRYNIMHWPQSLESGKLVEIFERRFVPHSVVIEPPVSASGKVQMDPLPDGSRRFESGTLQTEAAAYWSPIASLQNGTDISSVSAAIDQKVEEFRQRTTEYLNKTGSTVGAGGQSFEAVMNATIDKVKKQMPLFLQNLNSFIGETGQGLTYYIFRSPFPPFAESIAQKYPQYFMTTLPEIRTSWVNQRHRRITENGRVGYSVKFVSFDYLQKRPVSAVGGGAQSIGPWTNGLFDSELSAAGSTSPIKH